MNLFDITISSNINDVIQKLINLNDEIFSQNNQEAYEHMLYLYKILIDEKLYQTNTNWSFLLKDNIIFSRLIVSVWSQLSKVYRQFVYPSNLVIPKETINEHADLNERNVCIFHYINELTFYLTKNQYEHDDLVKFNESLVKNKLLNKLIRFFDDVNWQNSELIQIANTIRNISKNSFQMDKKIWKTLEIESKLKSSVNMNDSNFKRIVNSIVLRINQKTVRESIEYFINIEDAQEIIDSKQAYVDFYYLKKILKKPNFKDFHLFSEYKTLDLFCNILQKFFEMKDELDFKGYVQKTEDADADEVDLNSRKISIFDSTLFIINKCAFKSILLGLYFNQRKLIKILCDFVNSEDFIKKSLISIRNTLFSNMTILILYSEENKNEWVELCPVSNLLDLLDKHSENAYNSRQINIMIGYLANDKQIDNLKQIEAYSNVLLNHLKEIATKFDRGEAMKQIKCEYLTESKKMVTHNTYSSYFNGMLTGTLNALTRLAVNQKEKKIFFPVVIKPIETIIKKGNDLEKYFALKLLAQLNFDKDNSKEISKNTQLVNYLTDNSRHLIKVSDNNENNLDDELRFICANILWMLKQNENLTENEDKKIINTNDPNPTTDKHIMISYSWNVQKECLQIKRALEKLNHLVWMDVDQMSGSTIETMSKAVDNSFCLLICVNEKYKMSENCQLEAKYALKRQKPFIPIIMQEGYGRVDGWLGFLISDKLYIDFTSKRNNFEKCIGLLEAEIQKIISINNVKAVVPNVNLDSSKNIENKSEISKGLQSIKSWDSEQLIKWLNDNKIHQEIINSFGKLDGSCLEQFYHLSIENPQFVYQSLINEAHEKLKLADVLLFITRVKTLFQTYK